MDEWIEEAFDDELMVRPAGSVALDLDDAVVVLQEHVPGASFDESKHPRWPKGSGKKAGEFMRVGEHFISGGKEWEIAHITHGKVYAHLATAKISETQTKAFDVAHGGMTAGEQHPHVPNVQHTLPTATGKQHATGHKYGADVTIVDPYVDASSHDPSIAKPANAGSPKTGALMSDEEWQRFGRLDQEHYVDLQEHFGEWSPSKTKKLMNATYAQYNSTIADMVKNAYDSQYGSSSGYSLSLLSGIVNKAKGLFSGEQAKREKAKQLVAEQKAIIQWDLYNRTRSPDLTIFHRSHDSASFWTPYLKGEHPIFSGLSQSFSYGASGPSMFGPNALMTPIAIRHVMLATYVAHPLNSSTMAGELEVATDFQLKLDPKRSRILMGNALTSNQKTWLSSMTDQPAGGQVAEQIAAAIDSGEILPTAPAPPNLVMNAHAQAWTAPPAAAFHDIEKMQGAPVPHEQVSVGDAIIKDGAPYVVASIEPDGTIHGSLTEGATSAMIGWGAPQTVSIAPHEDVGMAESVYTMKVQPGDYVMGLKGTKYVLVSNPDEPKLGMQYVKADGSSWPLAGGDGKKFYKLAGHYDLPKSEAAGAQEFSLGDYVHSPDKEFIGKLPSGTKILLAQNAYEIGEPAGGGFVHVTQLETGNAGMLNDDFQTSYLVPVSEADAHAAKMADKQAAADALKASAKIAHVAATSPAPPAHANAETNPLDVKSMVEIGHNIPIAKMAVGDVFQMNDPKHTYSHGAYYTVLESANADGYVKVKRIANEQGQTVSSHPYHITPGKAKWKKHTLLAMPAQVLPEVQTHELKQGQIVKPGGDAAGLPWEWKVGKDAQGDTKLFGHAGGAIDMKPNPGVTFQVVQDVGTAGPDATPSEPGSTREFVLPHIPTATNAVTGHVHTPLLPADSKVLTYDELQPGMIVTMKDLVYAGPDGEKYTNGSLRLVVNHPEGGLGYRRVNLNEDTGLPELADPSGKPKYLQQTKLWAVVANAKSVSHAASCRYYDVCGEA
jgi:hypothetical protein